MITTRVVLRVYHKLDVIVRFFNDVIGNVPDLGMTTVRIDTVTPGSS